MTLGPLFNVPRIIPKESADCREGSHWFCSGRRWVSHDGRKNVYAKCQCHCHRSAEEASR